MGDLSTSINEAEVYKSMGLYEEAMNVYRRLLTDRQALRPEEEQTIKQKLEEIRKELEDQSDISDEDVSKVEITPIKQSLSAQENAQTILDAAFAFKELGLYEEAVNEYKRLIAMGYPSKKIIPEMAKCLMKLHSPKKASEEAISIIESQGIGEKREAQLKLHLGMEMEKVGQPELAIQLYKSALALDPEENRIKNRLLVLEKHQQKAQQERGEDISTSPEIKERRREDRFTPKLPEFVYVEFELQKGPFKGKNVRLQVLNYSKHGLGLLVTDKDKELLDALKPGDRIKNVAFYARWAIIKVEVLIKQISKLEVGSHKGYHVIGVESDEIIESSKALS